MTAIRPSNIHGTGLFATRTYVAGDIIISNLQVTDEQHLINAIAVLQQIPKNISFQSFLRTITEYEAMSMNQANVTRHERYDEQFQIVQGDLVALRDIKANEELFDTYPALVWLNQQGQSINADQYITHVFRIGHPYLNPNATMSERVTANYAARTFPNIIYLDAMRSKNMTAYQVIAPFVRQYIARQLSRT